MMSDNIKVVTNVMIDVMMNDVPLLQYIVLVYDSIYYQHMMLIDIYRIRRAFGPTACRDPFWMVQWSKSPTFT